MAQFNLGSGRTELMSENKYDDGAEHSVEFSRSGKSAKLIMDLDSDNGNRFICNNAIHIVIYVCVRIFVSAVNKMAPGLLADLDVTGDSVFVGGLKNPIPQT